MRPKLRREKPRRARSLFCSIFRQTDIVPLSSWWCVGEDGQAERSQATAPFGARLLTTGSASRLQRRGKRIDRSRLTAKGVAVESKEFISRIGPGAGGRGEG